MNLYCINNERISPAPGTKIIKKAELQNLFDANDIIASGESMAEQIKSKAELDYQQRYEEGFVKGQEDGKVEYADKILELVMTQIDTLADLESDMATVVIDSVKKVIGEIPNDELIKRVVRNAINSVRGMKRLLVRVSVDDEPILREDLKMMLVSPDGSSGYIELQPDANLHHGDCVLETNMGIVNASLEFQIEMLKKAINSRIQQNAAE